MALADDLVDIVQDEIEKSKETTTYAGTISTTNPLTVILDGSGVPIPCIAAQHIIKKTDGRVVVQQVGSDYVVTANLGVVAYPVGITLAEGQRDLAAGNSTFTSTSYGSGSGVIGTTFTVGGLGAVLVLVTLVNMSMNATDNGYVSFEIREGDVIGSGAQVFAPNNNHSISLTDVDVRGGTLAKIVTGLTPGQKYNARVQARVSAGTLTLGGQRIMVVAG